MSLYAEDAPPNARICNACDGSGAFVTRWADGDVRYRVPCGQCDGSGRLLCFLHGHAKTPKCEGFATHFFDEGQDDMCDYCWSHCTCGEKVLFFANGDSFCPVCDSSELSRRTTTEIVAAATAR